MPANCADSHFSEPSQSGKAEPDTVRAHTVNQRLIFTMQQRGVPRINFQNSLGDKRSVNFYSTLIFSSGEKFCALFYNKVGLPYAGVPTENEPNEMTNDFI